MNNQALVKKWGASIVMAISILSIHQALANDGVALTDDRDYSTEQALGRLAAEKADKVAIAREFADKWSVFTDESIDTLFQAFYNANDQQLSAIENAQDYESVRSILLGPPPGSSGTLSKTLNKLGDSNKDLVYSPIVPCRVVDTRKKVGAFSSGTKRAYYVWGFLGPGKTNIFNQGGNKFGCVSPRGEPAAVHMVISANPVAPESNAGKGNVQVAPHGIAIPKAVLLKYELGTNITNAVTVKTAEIAGRDIDIQVNGQKTHIVIDVMGYYYKVDKNDADRLPIAFGYIKADGTKVSGTENMTSHYNSVFEYVITIPGLGTALNDVSTIVTPNCSSHVTVNAGKLGDKILINFREGSSKKKCAFQFVTFKNQ